MRFSERIGRKPIKTILQIDTIDKDLQNGLWNAILEDFFRTFSTHKELGAKLSPRAKVCKWIWKDFFKMRVDHFFGSEETIKHIEEWYFFKSDWAEKYDLIEVISKIADGFHLGFTSTCNSIMKREMSGYRIVEGCIVQISSEEEIVAIEEAIDNSDPYKSVNEHLRTALEFLSDRKNPDYRNSIKESISAVESFCKIVTEDSKATLGPALAVIEKKFELHGSLKSAFKSLYGYTSDAGGIRHAMLEDQAEIRFEDAKFMLVTCSAFINYLKVKVSA